MAGHVFLVGLDLFDTTEEHTGEAYSVRLGLEAPEQIGRVERRGDMLKKMMSEHSRTRAPQAENRWR